MVAANEIPADASRLEQGRSRSSSDRGPWCHHLATGSRWASPPILQNLVFGTHKGQPDSRATVSRDWVAVGTPRSSRGPPSGTKKLRRAAELEDRERTRPGLDQSRGSRPRTRGWLRSS